MILMAKVTFNHHIAHEFSVSKHQVQRGTFHSWLTDQLCQVVIFHMFQEVCFRMLAQCSSSSEIQTVCALVGKIKSNSYIFYTKETSWT